MLSEPPDLEGCMMTDHKYNYDNFCVLKCKHSCIIMYFKIYHMFQFFESLKGTEGRKKLNNMMRLDQSPLSKLISSNKSSPWREGAQIQLESLQASDQQLLRLQRKTGHIDMVCPLLCNLMNL
jgi:hypothetical protein